MFCEIDLKILWDLKNLTGTGFKMGQILWDFISQCEIWHVCISGCAEGMFECRDGGCVEGRMECDGIPQCEDGSDEIDCRK